MILLLLLRTGAAEKPSQNDQHYNAIENFVKEKGNCKERCDELDFKCSLLLLLYYSDKQEIYYGNSNANANTIFTYSFELAIKLGFHNIHIYKFQGFFSLSSHKAFKAWETWFTL